MRIVVDKSIGTVSLLELPLTDNQG